MLVSADQFLARPSGEIFEASAIAGSSSLTVDLVTGPFQIRGLDEHHARRLAHRFADFAIEDDDVQPLPLTLSLMDAAAFRSIDTRGWEYTLSIDETTDQFQIAGLGFCARGGSDTGFELVLGRDDQLEGAIDNLLRVWIAHRAFAAGGLLLHSAGLLVENGAVICVGRSGAGKSTLSKLNMEAGFDLLSDELNVILPSDGGLLTRLLPFAGDVQREGKRPTVDAFDVCGLLRLEQAADNQVAPISAAALVATVVAAAPFLNADPRRFDALGDRAAALIANTRCGVLRFRPEASAIDALRAWA